MFVPLALAAPQAAPEVAVPARIITPQAITYSDYPAASMRRDEYGLVSVAMDVTPEGKVASCTVTESSGFVALDNTTCALFKARLRFDPAKDASGAPISSVYRTVFTWGLDRNQPRSHSALTLQIDKLPAGYRSPASARLQFAGTGRVSSCEVARSSGSEVADKAACAYLGREFTIPPFKSQSPEVPALALRTLTLTWSTTPPNNR